MIASLAFELLDVVLGLVGFLARGLLLKLQRDPPIENPWPQRSVETLDSLRRDAQEVGERGEPVRGRTAVLPVLQPPRSSSKRRDLRPRQEIGYRRSKPQASVLTERWRSPRSQTVLVRYADRANRRDAGCGHRTLIFRLASVVLPYVTVTV